MFDIYGFPIGATPTPHNDNIDTHVIHFTTSTFYKLFPGRDPVI